MESKAASLISESDLSKSVKSLRATKGHEHADSLGFDAQIAAKLGGFSLQYYSTPSERVLSD